jgi:hypothetical protein
MFCDWFEVDSNLKSSCSLMFSAFNGEMSMGCGISTETYGAQRDSLEWIYGRVVSLYRDRSRRKRV